VHGGSAVGEVESVNLSGLRRYRFRDYSGYVIAPWISGIAHDLVSIRHSASEPPWVDRDVHLHDGSEEVYFLFQGELQLLVAGSVFTLKPREVLKVNPRVPHAVVGGSGPIEHFVIRMPARDDRRAVGEVPAKLAPVAGEAKRELRLDWGCRAPLTEARYQNCWLFGVGQARFQSDHMCLAYLNFPTDESADLSGRSHRHRLHLHQRSWEYYTVLQGTRVLQIEAELVEINAGEILEVPPQAKHVLRATRTPFEGFTFRVPRLADKVEF
jgi:mannose-6-phosphate isomerase-like protein (cupin superfamily)